MVCERLGDGREVELCQCDANPETIVRALQKKRTGSGRTPCYTSIRIVENFAEDAAEHPAGETLMRASAEPETALETGVATMRVNDVFPSKYLSAADVKALGRDVIDVLQHVEMQELESQDSGKQRKPVAILRNHKPFVLNRTNWDLLVEFLGADDSDAWINAHVQIGVEKVRFGRDLVDGLRIRNARPAGTAGTQGNNKSHPPQGGAAPAPAPTVGRDIDDDLPFISSGGVF
jgi:hypothetical protein